MKHSYSQTLRKLTLSFVTLLAVSLSATADDKEKHEMSNMCVVIPATEYKTCHFIEKETIGNKEYIMGKSTSYTKKGEANAGTLLQPYAEYEIKNKIPGGGYHVTVFYTIDKEKAPQTPKISIGMNTQKPQEIEIKDKLVKSVRATFKVNFLKGQNHTVKIWFPSEGVKVHEIKVTRALLPKGSKKNNKDKEA